MSLQRGRKAELSGLLCCFKTFSVTKFAWTVREGKGSGNAGTPLLPAAAVHQLQPHCPPWVCLALQSYPCLALCTKLLLTAVAEHPHPLIWADGLQLLSCEQLAKAPHTSSWCFLAGRAGYLASSPLNPSSWPCFRERHSEQIQLTEKISFSDDELCQRDKAFEEWHSQA